MGLWKYDKYLCKKYSCEKNYIKHYFLANDILQKVIMFDQKYTINGYSKASDEKIVKRKKTRKAVVLCTTNIHQQQDAEIHHLK